MDTNAIIGAVILGLVSICGFLLSWRKTIKDDLKPLQDLNANMIELNANFKNMLENDKIRDERITKHGREIEEVKDQQQKNEKILDRHELRISSLENRREAR